MTTRDTLKVFDLSFDLTDKILSRVPAASLVRLRLTCKRWNALLKDPKFVEKQSDKASEQRSLFMISESKIYTMNLNLDEVQNKAVDTSTLLSLKNFHNSEQVRMSEIFHCDGLFLCPTKDDRLVVWNPCTCQTRWIQYCNHHKYNPKFVLGYESQKSCGQSYKILMYTPICNMFRCFYEYKVYDFSSNSWRRHTDGTPKRRIDPNRVSLKGNTYWLASEEGRRVLLSFDFSTERFRPQPVPRRGRPVALSVVREKRLSILYKKLYYPLKIEIWMTTSDEIDHTKFFSWSKFLSLDMHEDNHIYRSVSINTTFFIEEEKKAAVLCDGCKCKNYSTEYDGVYDRDYDSDFLHKIYY